MNFETLLESTVVSPQVSATTKRQALSVAAEIAARANHLKAGKVLEALMEREAQGGTGVGRGVAIPHCQIPGLTDVRGVFLRLESPIDFESIDEQPVDLIFALFAPPNRGSEHLRALACVSRLMRQPALRQQLRSAGSPDALRALLARDARPNAA